jgi:hypothetical protein
MNKTKRNKNEAAYRFATRVINTHGVFISAEDAWERLVNKNGVGMKGWVALQTHLASAVSQGLLSKQRGYDNKGRSRMLYGPSEMTPFESENFKGELATEIVDVVQRPNRPSIEDIPLGDILTYNGEERDDIMSVLTDLIYDTSLRELRTRYPTLEDLVWDIVGGDE